MKRKLEINYLMKYLLSSGSFNPSNIYVVSKLNGWLHKTEINIEEFITSKVKLQKKFSMLQYCCDLNINQIRKLVLICAECVLPIFEEKYNYDKRPRLAIEAAKKCFESVSFCNDLEKNGKISFGYAYDVEDLVLITNKTGEESWKAYKIAYLEYEEFYKIDPNTGNSQVISQKPSLHYKNISFNGKIANVNLEAYKLAKSFHAAALAAASTCDAVLLFDNNYDFQDGTDNACRAALKADSLNDNNYYSQLLINKVLEFIQFEISPGIVD